MNSISTQLAPALEQIIQETFNVSISEFEFQATRKEFEGDITLVVFGLLRTIIGNPVQIGETLGAALVERLEWVKGYNVVKGFLNLEITDAFFINELKEIVLKSSNPLEKKYIKERISKLSGIVSIIKVGGITESELKERIDRVDDAVCAVRSAKEEGVVAGGGVALMNAMFSLEKKLDDATANAITSPFFKILDNASYIKEPKEFKVPDYPKGIDVKNFKEIDMFKAGIVDSTKVIKNALINAVSVANTVLMTDNVITFARERENY